MKRFFSFFSTQICVRRMLFESDSEEEKKEEEKYANITFRLYFFFILLFWRVFCGVCAIFHATPPRPRAVDLILFFVFLLTCFSHYFFGRFALKLLSVIRWMQWFTNLNSLLWVATTKNEKNNSKKTKTNWLNFLSHSHSLVSHNVDFHSINYPNQ